MELLKCLPPGQVAALIRLKDELQLEETLRIIRLPEKEKPLVRGGGSFRTAERIHASGQS